MAVIEISRQQFDELNVTDHCRSLWTMNHERAWFKDDACKVIGVLCFDPELGLWGYSVCVHADGGYQRVALGADMPSESIARRELANAMAACDGSPPAPDHPA